MIPMAITLHHQTQQTFSDGMHVEEENMLLIMDIDFLVKRFNKLKVGMPEREDKITGNE